MDFTKLDGLIPAVVQDSASHEVLMVGFMNETALERTLRTGFATFYSRSRQSLWTKGETSGNRLKVDRVLVDCDDDTVVLKVTRLGDGNVCHTGTRSCFRDYEPRDVRGHAANEIHSQEERTGETSSRAGIQRDRESCHERGRT